LRKTFTPFIKLHLSKIQFEWLKQRKKLGMNIEDKICKDAF